LHYPFFFLGKRAIKKIINIKSIPNIIPIVVPTIKSIIRNMAAHAPNNTDVQYVNFPRKLSLFSEYFITREVMHKNKAINPTIMYIGSSCIPCLYSLAVQYVNAIAINKRPSKKIPILAKKSVFLFFILFSSPFKF